MKKILVEVKPEMTLKVDGACLVELSCSVERAGQEYHWKQVLHRDMLVSDFDRIFEIAKATLRRHMIDSGVNDG